ncbi:MAG: hypothetical protein RR421_05220 [Cetobacterium sp.]
MKIATLTLLLTASVALYIVDSQFTNAVCVTSLLYALQFKFREMI